MQNSTAALALVVGLGTLFGSLTVSRAQAPAPAPAAQPQPQPGLRYGIALTLKNAEDVMKAALDEAKERKTERLSIAIVDSGGRLVIFKRLDAAHYGSVELARAKALTALEFKIESAKVQEALLTGPDGIRILKVPAMPIAGGRLLIRKGTPGNIDQIAGAIGVSGDDEAADEVAKKASAINITP